MTARMLKKVHKKGIFLVTELFNTAPLSVLQRWFPDILKPETHLLDATKKLSGITILGVPVEISSSLIEIKNNFYAWFMIIW